MSQSLSGTLIQKFIMICLCSFLLLGLSGCATAKNDFRSQAQINDPLEPFNRGVFAFNNTFDRFLIEPVAKIYNAIFPDFFRDGVQNFMRNLRAPLIVGNNVLQGDFKGAGVATARFAINTTAGIGGLIDVAAAQALNINRKISAKRWPSGVWVMVFISSCRSSAPPHCAMERVRLLMRLQIRYAFTRLTVMKSGFITRAA